MCPECVFLRLLEALGRVCSQNLFSKLRNPAHIQETGEKHKKKSSKITQRALPTVALRAASTGQPQYFENVTLSGLTECSSTACWSSDNVE